MRIGSVPHPRHDRTTNTPGGTWSRPNIVGAEIAGVLVQELRRGAIVGVLVVATCWCTSSAAARSPACWCTSSAVARSRARRAGVDLVELAREVNNARAGARVLELLAGPTSHN